MRITSFWVQGYRSLRDVRVEDLAAINVFCGDNGAGKTSVVSALRALFGLIGWRAHPGQDFTAPERPFLVADAGGVIGGVIDDREQCLLGHTSELRLGARLVWPQGESGQDGTIPERPAKLDTLVVEVVYLWQERTLWFSRLHTSELDLIELEPLHTTPEMQARLERERRKAASLGKRFDHREFFATELGVDYTGHADYCRWLQRFVAAVARRAFGLVSADRAPRPERASASKDVPALLAAGRVKEALLRASRHPDAELRRRYRALCALLAGEPLLRPRFDLIEDPESRDVDLVEAFGGEARGGQGLSGDIPLHLLGMGVVQLYSIAAHAVLGGVCALGVDTPEAHVHGDAAAKVAALLRHVIEAGYVAQLFVATHSETLELGNTRRFRVEADPERGTVIKAPAPDQNL